MHYVHIVLFIILAVAIAGGAVNEKEILLELKQSLQIPAASVSYFLSWSSAADSPCKFSGISCSRDGSVVSIDLTGLSISGTIPFSSLCLLPSLSTLSLGSNRLSGHLSADIRNCSSLVHLDLAFNELTGEVPDLSLLSSLHLLNLTQNVLSGAFPWHSLSNLTALESLSLGDNYFDPSPFPTVVTTLTNLSWLYISVCNLHGEVPSSIGNLTRLINLEFADNFLSGEIPPEITKLNKLWQLELYNNSFTGKIPTGFGNLSDLVFFDASRNNLTGDLSELRPLNKLVSLQLYYNQLSGEIPLEFGDFRNLVNFSLYGNQLTGQIPPKIGSWSEFNFIDVSTNFLTGPIPPDMCRMGRMKKLLLLENQLTGEIPANYANCSSLIRFRVSKNSLSGTVPPGIWGLPKVNIIDLEMNQFEGPITKEIGNAKALNQLSIAHNKFSGDLPQEISGASALVAFDSSLNQLSGEIPASIGQLKSLSSLYLDNNHDISSDELILRQCASKSLLAFIHFASSLLKKDTENSLADGAACKEAPTGVETGQLNWTKAGIQCVIKSIFLKNMKESMTKDISIQKEWVSLLRDMVYNLHEIPDLNSFRPLCSQDAEVDFFNNILHLQVHRKRRALLRFKNAISAGNFAENIVVSIFVPLFFNMMINGKDGKGERMRDACLDSLAFIAAQMQWKSYCSFLMRCFREITVHPDKQKILVRLVCYILDNFHFYASSSDDMEKVPQVTSGVVVQGHSVRHVPPDIEVYLQKAVLPRIQKLLIMDSEKVNVNVSLAGLKLLKLLPADTMDSQLSSIIHHICSFLKNRLESLRDEARSALAVCANELGIEYLLFIIKILRATLKRGYEMHVLGYTLNLILSKTLTRNSIGSLDYCLEELLSIVENDILGDVAEEKEVGKIASKMKETRRNKSFETLKLISQSITFKTHAIRLLSRICKHMEQHLTPKTKRKLEIMLLNIASGIECNPSVQTNELFIFVYGLIEDGIVSEFSQCRGRLEALTNEKSLHDPKEKEKISCINAIGMKNSHLISVFALGVLHNRLKNMKVDKNDQQLLSMLDPFVKQLGDCLNSKYEDVLSAAFRCLASLVKLPLPSFDMYANKIKALLLCIAERSGNGNTPMVQSCLKLLMILLKCSRISISDDELHMIIQSPMFIDIQTAPSPLALSLLKSIVAQKLVVHEIYDIILRLAELMVTTLSEPIRKKCSQILLQFLLDYQLSEQRLQQHLNFLLSNLSYEHPLGREAVLEMLHAIIIKLPERVIDNNVQNFFLHLVVALVNEHNQKVRSMVSTVLKALIEKTSDHMLDPILEYSLSWYFGEKQNLWSAAAQVIGLLIEVLKGGIEKDIGAIVQTATKILKDSVDAVNDLKIGFSSELVGVPLWKEAYDSLFMLEKMLLHFPDLHFQLAFQEIWGMVCKFLLHPHVWLRNISSRLVALYFAAVSESRTDSEKINQTTLYLINPSKLFSIAVSFLTQLETQEMDDSIGKIIAQDIVFSICGLHSFAKQEYYTSFRKIWSMFDVSEQNSYLEAFDLLGSRGAKKTFVLSTSVTSQFLTKEEDTSALENIDNLQSLLVVPLLRKLGKIAVERDESQMKIVFNCLRMISSQIGTQGISDYSVYILLPLYKVCEGYAGKLVSDDVKQFAEEVRNGIRDLLGVDLFVQIYNQIRKKLKGKRDKRRQHQKLIAVINPMLHAKRKLRVAAKHQANKRRKIEAIKMGKKRT